MNNAKRVYQTTLIALAAIVCAASAQSPESMVLNETQKIVASDGETLDNFGGSVAISGDFAVVGAGTANSNGLGTAGVAYVYQFDGKEWREVGKLVPSDSDIGDQFGRSVAISGNTIVVGAWLDDDNGSASGSVYAFRFNGLQWVEEDKILAADGDAGDAFGFSVAISGNTIVVGAWGDDDNGDNSGAAYIFRHTDKMGWIEESKLLASDASELDRLGIAASISNNTVVVGADGDTDAGPVAGAAYVFQFDGHEWVEATKLLPTSGSGHFGGSVANSGNTVFVAEPFPASPTDPGEVAVFEKTGSEWIRQQVLRPLETTQAEGFGSSLATDGDTLAIGAILDEDSGLDSGSAYLFKREEHDWIQYAKLLPADGEPGDNFGISVGVSSSIVLTGAWHDDDNGLESGSAYFFRAPPLCRADLYANGTLDIFDVFVFLKAFIAQDPIADWDHDGVLLIDDVFDYLDAFSNGCP